MQITYILGNGFDLQLGLKSCYSDFLKEYVNTQDEDTQNIKDFKEYLKSDKGSDFWSDAEKAMGVHCHNVSKLSMDGYRERIQDFELHMLEYLQKQQARCVWDNISEIGKIFKSFILESFKDSLNRRSTELDMRPIAEPHTYSFITFNYTNLIDNLISIGLGSPNTILLNRQIKRVPYEDRVERIYHVHGDLESQIIMGVNDESQISLDESQTLTDELKLQLIKPNMNKLSNHNWDAPGKAIIQKSKIIFSYGVSFGETDKLWWEEIAKWLKKDASNKFVVFEHNPQMDSVFKLPWQEVQYENQKRREILSKIGIQNEDPDFNQLMNQVYIIVNTRRLDLQKVLGTNHGELELAAGGIIAEEPTFI